MARRKPFPPRPEKPFRVGTLQWSLDNVANHVQAGFPPVSEGVVRAHFFQYLQFLQRHAYTTRLLVGSLSDLESTATLWSTDLTPEGYRFMQYSHDRWIRRLLNYTDDSRESALLERWRKAFASLPSETFSSESDT